MASTWAAGMEYLVVVVVVVPTLPLTSSYGDKENPFVSSSFPVEMNRACGISRVSWNEKGSETLRKQVAARYPLVVVVVAL